MNEALCCNCLKLQSNLNFLCSFCSSTRIINQNDLNKLNIVHIDCDAFFASVEKATNPALTDIPIIISSSTYGVVTTACYKARKFGIYSTMPVQQALRLCPKVKIISPNMEKYKKFSKHIHNLLLRLTPLVESASIDEYYLDFHGTERLHKANAYTLMQNIAKQIKQELNITVSIGLSYCKFMAKFSSDLKKPFGFSIITKEEAKNIIANYPVNRINGAGKNFAKKLELHNIKLIKDLQNTNPIVIKQLYGKIGEQLQLYSLGIDNRKVTPIKTIKTVSKEKTFLNCIKDKDEIKNQLYLLSQKLSDEMKDKNIVGNIIFLKLTLANKQKLIRSIQLKEHSNLCLEIFETAYLLLEKIATNMPIYLLGVGAKNIIKAHKLNYNISFDTDKTKKINIEKATYIIRSKFGSHMINLAPLQHKKL